MREMPKISRLIYYRDLRKQGSRSRRGCAGATPSWGVAASRPQRGSAVRNANSVAYSPNAALTRCY